MHFFTSDTHFGHANIIKYCDRPFANVEQMNQRIIDNWNSKVSAGDTVFFLGDFCFGDPNDYIPQLNGKIIFIKGSHDPKIDAPYMFVYKTSKVKENGHRKTIVLCHYAMRSWETSHYGAWHLFGHHHGKLPPYGLSFDVGVDCWDYYPLSLEEVQQQMSKLSPIVDYSKKH